MRKLLGAILMAVGFMIAGLSGTCLAVLLMAGGLEDLTGSDILVFLAGPLAFGAVLAAIGYVVMEGMPGGNRARADDKEGRGQ